MGHSERAAGRARNDGYFWTLAAFAGCGRQHPCVYSCESFDCEDGSTCFVFAHEVRALYEIIFPRRQSCARDVAGGLLSMMLYRFIDNILEV